MALYKRGKPGTMTLQWMGVDTGAQRRNQSSHVPAWSKPN